MAGLEPLIEASSMPTSICGTHASECKATGDERRGVPQAACWVAIPLHPSAVHLRSASRTYPGSGAATAEQSALLKGGGVLFTVVCTVVVYSRPQAVQDSRLYR